MSKRMQKEDVEKLTEKLLVSRKSGCFNVSEETLKDTNRFCEGYKEFMNSVKTEREAVSYVIEKAEKAGFVPYRSGKHYLPDPNYPDVFESNNSCYLNGGVGVEKYTGGRGKSSTSEARAEFIDEIRSLFDKNDVLWQVGEIGKVDAGGSGTVAKFIASLNLDVIDVGVPVLSMHAPFEVVSKLDIFMTYRGIRSFFGN